jgi:hypothetical protein
MRSPLKYAGILAIIGTVALADPTPTATPTPAAPPTKPLSVEEMRAQAKVIIENTQTALRSLLHLKEVAKKQKDLIKLNCVNDKLVKLKAQINITENANDALQASLSSGSDERFTLFTDLSNDGKQVSDIENEGAACVGEIELYKQEAGLTVDHPDIPDDPTQLEPFNEDVEPPGYASPFN